MSKCYRPERLTATGNVTSAANGGNAIVHLTPAAAVATATIRQSGAGGTIIMDLQAPANGQSVTSPEFRFEGQLHITLAGAGAFVSALT